MMKSEKVVIVCGEIADEEWFKELFPPNNFTYCILSGGGLALVGHNQGILDQIGKLLQETASNIQNGKSIKIYIIFHSGCGFPGEKSICELRNLMISIPRVVEDLGNFGVKGLTTTSYVLGNN